LGIPTVIDRYRDRPYLKYETFWWGSPIPVKFTEALE
jgi:hypothetical protein